MISVRALPRGFDADQVRVTEEKVVCDHFDWYAHESRQCSGLPEIEVTIGRLSRADTRRVRLCREHATSVARQLDDAVLLCDGRDLMEMGDTT